MASSTLSKSKRFNEIFHILLTHNITSLLRDLAAYARDRHAAEGLGTNGVRTVPSRVRALLEELGPTFIKIGQLLGTRPDLIPQPFIEEFKKLYDQTAPTPFPEVRVMVERELGRPVAEVFSHFDEAAIASASIGQVHRAVLKNGQVVAVKVQHPEIEERMATDFEILRVLVRFTERVFAKSRIFQPEEHLEEIRIMLNKELDYRNELRVQKEVEHNFAQEPTVKIPHPFDEHSTQRVLVMEFIDGIKFRGPNQPELASIDRKNVARIITNAMAKQVFVDRLFHADPSPGNLLILGSNQVCFLDFGAFGVVTRRRARLILELLTSISNANHEETARAMIELCDVRGEYDHRKFMRDVEKISDYHEREKASPADPVLLQMIIDIANAHRMTLPADFMLITRALYQFDGICKALDSDYELVEALQPFVDKLLRERIFNPEHQVDNVKTAIQELARLATRVPVTAEKIMYKLEKGELGMQVDIKGLNDYKKHQMRIVFITCFTLLMGFLLIGSAIGYGLGGAGFIRDYSFLGLFSFLAFFLAYIYGSGLYRRRRL
jgi:ubiquinone biosynthesis protein